MADTLKKTEFPTFGNPTITIFKEVPNLPMIGGWFNSITSLFGGQHVGAGDDMVAATDTSYLQWETERKERESESSVFLLMASSTCLVSFHFRLKSYL